MMQEYLQFGKLDSSQLFETIRRHFPIGVLRRNEEDKMLYQAYPGLKLYSQSIQHSIHDSSVFEGVWQSLETELESIVGLPVVGTTYGQAPCYSSSIKVRQEQLGSLVRHFDIHIFVSVIGPYFTVIGKDWSEISFEENLLRPTNFYSISPCGRDARLFNTTVDLLKVKFPVYRFIPHCLYSLPVPEFQVPYSDEEENIVFNGVFNQEFRPRSLIVGDSYFGHEEWVSSNCESQQGSWEIHPPNGA
jgi:hypothetical protein